MKLKSNNWPSNVGGQRSVKSYTIPGHQILCKFFPTVGSSLCSKIVAKIRANQLPCEEPQVNYPVGMHKL